MSRLNNLESLLGEFWSQPRLLKGGGADYIDSFAPIHGSGPTYQNPQSKLFEVTHLLKHDPTRLTTYARANLLIQEGLIEWRPNTGEDLSLAASYYLGSSSSKSPASSTQDKGKGESTWASPCGKSLCAAGGTPGTPGAVPSSHSVGYEISPSEFPPFFTYIRVSVNDLPAFQTKVVAPESEISPFFKSTEIADDDKVMRLGLSFNQRVSINITNPGNVLTLELVEKDFCTELGHSEQIIGTVNLPLGLLKLRKNFELVLRVACNLPESFSLNSLQNAAAASAASVIKKSKSQQGGLSDGFYQGPHLKVLPPAVAVCKVRILLRQQAVSLAPLWVCELASLALQTESPLETLQNWDSSRQVGTIHPGADRFVLGLNKFGSHTSISAFHVLEMWMLLVVALTSSGVSAEYVRSALASEKEEPATTSRTQQPPVAIHTGVTDREEDVKKIVRSVDYAAFASNFAEILMLTIVGPLRSSFAFVVDVLNLRRPMITLGLLIALWGGYAAYTPRTYGTLALLFMLTFTVHGFRHIHVAQNLESRGGDGENVFASYISRLSSLAGSESMVKLIENAAISEEIVEKLQLAEIWASRCAKTLINHPATKENSSTINTALLSYFTRSRGWHFTLLYGVFSLVAPNWISGITQFAISMLGTIVILNRMKLITLIRRIFVGLSRYSTLTTIRKNIIVTDT